MLAAVYEANPFAPASRISAPGRGGGGGGRTERGDALSPYRVRTGGGEPPALPRRSAPRRSAPRAAMAGGRTRTGGGGRRRREGGGRTADSELRGPLRTGAGWDRALRWTFPASLKPRRSGRPLHPSELPGRSVPPAARPDLAPRVRSERRAKRPAPLPGASVLSSRGSEPPAALEVGGFSFQTMPVIHSLVS